MTNKDVIDYITKTPHNTNPTILKQHLEEQDAQKPNRFTEHHPKGWRSFYLIFRKFYDIIYL